MKSKASTHPDEAELRRYALSFPDVREDFPWGESAFKVRNKVFLFMYVSVDGIKLSVKLPRSNETALDRPFAQATGYGLGKSGWVTCQFGPGERVPLDPLRRWIEESFRAVAPKRVSALLDEASGAGGTRAKAASTAPQKVGTVRKKGTSKRAASKPAEKRSPKPARKIRKKR